MLKCMTIRASLVALVCFLSVSVYAIADAPKVVDVPAGNLTVALETLAKQTGAELIYSSEDLRHIQTQGVHGRYTTEKAVAKLLEGTKLHLTIHGTGAILISDESAGSGAATPPEGRARLESESDSADRLRFAQGTQVGSPAMSAAANSASGPNRDKESNQSESLEEIVVTAQKRTERLIDVPQSVSVISSSDLNTLAATQFRDFAATVPGLSFTTAGAGNTQLTMRGVTVGGDISPTVAIYVDDVPYGSSTNFSLAAQLGLDVGLFDLDRVEVLRGPQGTLYGASAMGGLVKYVTKQPGTHAFGGEAQAGTSSTQFGGINFNAAAAVNFPLVNDQLAVRVSGFESRDGGFIDNVATGAKDVNRSDIYGGRLDVLYTPTDALSVRINTFIQNISRDGEGTADYTFSGAKPYGDLGQFRPFPEPFSERYRLVSGTIDYDFGWARLTSISSYQTTHVDSFWDVSLTYGPLLNGFGFGPYSAVGSTNESTNDKFTQEMRLASGKNRDLLEWVIGGFYTHESSSLNEMFELRDAAGQPSPNLFYTYLAPSLYKEYAVFGDMTWKFTSKFDVTGGIRYAHNSQEETQVGSGFFTGSHPTLTSSDGVVTYLANARYHITDRSTAYVRYATGYRPGGPNVVTIAGGPPTFASDKVKSYEGGFKAETRSGTFGLDVSGYYIDWDNIQISVLRGGFETIANAPGGATIRGMELALNAHPIDQWKVATIVAYQDAKISKADANLGASEGERLPNVPRFTAALISDYQFFSGGLQPTVGASLRYVGVRFDSFDTSTLPQYRLPSYKSVDLRSSINLGPVNTQFYVHNLLDDRSELSIIFPQFGSRVAIAQPRTIGFLLTTKF